MNKQQAPGVSLDRLPSTGSLRQAPFDRLRVNGNFQMGRVGTPFVPTPLFRAVASAWAHTACPPYETLFSARKNHVEVDPRSADPDNPQLDSPPCRWRHHSGNGGSYRSPRNEKLLTRSGLEGSSRSSGLVCRGVAGAGRLHLPDSIVPTAFPSYPFPQPPWLQSGCEYRWSLRYTSCT